MPRPFTLRRWIPWLATAALLACGTDALTPDPVVPPDHRVRCPEGSLLAGQTSGGVLTPDESPYHLQQSLVILEGGLTVLAGVTICADSANSLIIEGPLQVLGTDDEPVHFTWLNPDTTRAIRHGYKARGPVVLKHAVFEGAGIEATRTPFQAEDVVVRGTLHEAISLSEGSLTRVLIDSSCSAECDGGAVWSPYDEGDLILEDVTIRNSGAAGISIRTVGYLQVDGLTLESIAGDGIGILYTFDPLASGARALSPIRYSGVGGDVVEAPAQIAHRLVAAGLVGVDGSVADVALTGSFPIDPGLELGPGPRWRIAGRRVDGVAFLPGAHVAFPDSTAARSIVAKGTTEEPVVWEGPGHLVLFGERTLDRQPGEGPVLEHLRVERGLRVSVAAPRTRIAQSSWLGAGTLRVIPTARDVSIERTSFRESVGPAVETLAIGTTLALCEVSGSATDGVVVRGTDAWIRYCNLVDNAGDGVAAQGVEEVDARANWWGTPQGPGTPAGDGVRGSVDASGPLDAPVGPDTDPDDAGAPVRIDAPDTLTVPTGTSVVLQAVARDAAGRPTFGPPIRATLADPSRAMIDPDYGRVVVGLRPGTTTVELSSASAAAPRKTVVVRVVPGGPAFEWSRPDVPDDVHFGGVWAASPRDVIAVGGGYTVHFNGSGWNVGFGEYLNVNTVFGEAGRIYGTGSKGIVELPPDRAAWRFVADRGYGFPFGDLWVSSTGVLFSSGNHQVVYDGGEEFTHLYGPFRCTSVWGRSATEVYFACEDGVHRWDGSGFSPLDSGMPEHRERAVWATADYLWFAGDEGSAERISDAGSYAFETGTRSDLLDIHGTDDDEVFIVGRDDTLLYWDGSVMRSLWVPGTGDITDVWTVDGHLYLIRDNDVLAGRPVES